ncbi:hypothetical protein Mapa_009056 [Marchantia paleacea]|nr:hypothetical protein Mapa_009056 [Marchantia paleacea]
MCSALPLSLDSVWSSGLGHINAENPDFALSVAFVCIAEIGGKVCTNIRKWTEESCTTLACVMTRVHGARLVAKRILMGSKVELPMSTSETESVDSVSLVDIGTSVFSEFALSCRSICFWSQWLFTDALCLSFYLLLML